MVSVSYPSPEEWTNRHASLFEKGNSKAWQPFRDSISKDKPDGDESLIPSATETLLFGVAQVCETEWLDIDLKALDLPMLWGLPLHYNSVLSWIASEVGGAYQRARAVPKNS